MSHETLIDDLGYLVSNDVLKMFLGEKLGDGQFREVYALKIDETRVVKIEKGDQFENIAESDVWNNVKDTKWASWFCPVLWVSPFGSALIQPRCKPLPPGFRPKKLPDFFGDLKSDNWGMLHGKLVCFDYGHHKFYRNGLKQSKMVKATFRS